MKSCGGVWLPDHETHMVEWMTHNNVKIDGKLTYQWGKLVAAMQEVRSFRTAVDAGAHCGTWSMHMVNRFSRLVAFEPVLEHRECLLKNVNGSAGNVTLIACALGEKEGSIRMDVPPGSSGGTHVAGDGDIPLATLDSFKLTEVDFLKVDVEGFEYPLIKGAEQTIRRDRPVIVIEQKPKGLAERYGYKRMQAVELLQSWGATVKFEMSGDFCLTFPA